MKVRIQWECLYSDGDNSWRENRFRILNIDDPDRAINTIIDDYKQKYQCEPIKTNDGLHFADDLDSVSINNFSIERMGE